MVSSTSFPPASAWRPLLQWAIAEDLGSGDVTTNLILSAERQAAARLEARESLVVCGLELAAAVFAELDPSLEFRPEHMDGDRVRAGAPLASLAGNARNLLAGERTALNFLGRMCGVASFTRRFVEAVAGTGAEIVDTRKTLPGWRVLDKYAVAVGGGCNHRVGLYDAILVKDNHIAVAGGVAEAVKSARAAAPPHLWLEVEVESEDDAAAALEAGADALLLDNRTPAELERFAARFGSDTVLEASGGVNLSNVRRVAETGVQRISIGALTHSAPNADVALETLPDGVRA